MATITSEAAATDAPVTLRVEDGIARVRLDQPGKPVNVLSARLLEEMEMILGRLERREDGERAPR